MNDDFDFPDMDDLASQMGDAMEEAKKAMEDLPMPMGDLEGVMESLSALMGGLPEQMEGLGSALGGFAEQHAENSAAMAGEPDWSVEAGIRVGKKLDLVVQAVLDFGKVRQAWSSTQGAGFEDLVAGVAAGSGEEFEPKVMGQIMGQLKKGRSLALVQDVKVLACRIQGAPGNAADKLQLSPEGNIPLVMDEDGIGFEFAPLLTIRNQWENADIPRFTPMGEEIVVQMALFEAREPFEITFTLGGQEEEMMVTLHFQPLDG
jgi:hypothetical protein